MEINENMTDSYKNTVDSDVAVVVNELVDFLESIEIPFSPNADLLELEDMPTPVDKIPYKNVPPETLQTYINVSRQVERARRQVGRLLEHVVEHGTPEKGVPSQKAKGRPIRFDVAKPRSRGCAKQVRFELPQLKKIKLKQQFDWLGRPEGDIWQFELNFQDPTAIKDRELLNRFVEISRHFAPLISNNKSYPVIEDAQHRTSLANALSKMNDLIKQKKRNVDVLSKKPPVRAVTSSNLLIYPPLPVDEPPAIPPPPPGSPLPEEILTFEEIPMDLDPVDTVPVTRVGVTAVTYEVRRRVLEFLKEKDSGITPVTSSEVGPQIHNLSEPIASEHLRISVSGGSQILQQKIGIPKDVWKKMVEERENEKEPPVVSEENDKALRKVKTGRITKNTPTTTICKNETSSLDVSSALTEAVQPLPNLNIPNEIWSMIAKNLSLEDLKQFGLCCKEFRSLSLFQIMKKGWFKINLTFTKTFATKTTKFCRDIVPAQLACTRSRLMINVNAARFRSQLFPLSDMNQVFQNISEKLVFVPKRNECYTVKSVFKKFSVVDFQVGIGMDWQIPCFVEIWNLLASDQVVRFKLTINFGNDSARRLNAYGFLDNLDMFENVKYLSILFFDGGRLVQPNVIQRDDLRVIVQKFPNVSKIETCPMHLMDDLIKVVEGVWEINDFSPTTIASKNS